LGILFTGTWRTALSTSSAATKATIANAVGEGIVNDITRILQVEIEGSNTHAINGMITMSTTRIKTQMRTIQ